MSPSDNEKRFYTNGALLYIPCGYVRVRSARLRFENGKNRILQFKPMRGNATYKCFTLATFHVYPKPKQKSYVKPIDKFCQR